MRQYRAEYSETLTAQISAMEHSFIFFFFHRENLHWIADGRSMGSPGFMCCLSEENSAIQWLLSRTISTGDMTKSK